MRDSIKASSYVPHIYEGFAEMDRIVKVDDNNIDAAERTLTELIDNQWVITATDEGLKSYEEMLGITADTSIETLEFRRERLLNRLSSRMPFTLQGLRKKLDTIIGQENYLLTVDYDKYIIYLQSSSSNQVWYTETMITIAGMKPCNMVFVNNPLIMSNIKLSETVYLSSVTDNYTLGSGFKLGTVPFSTIESEKVIKMPSTSSFTDKLLDDVASFTASTIAFAIVTGMDDRSSMIVDFVAKAATDNLINIEYDVPESIDTAIKSIELYDAGGNMLSSLAVYIPTADNVRIKHTIVVKEEG